MWGACYGYDVYERSFLSVIPIGCMVHSFRSFVVFESVAGGYRRLLVNSLLLLQYKYTLLQLLCSKYTQRMCGGSMSQGVSLDELFQHFFEEYQRRL